jgi:hypothetical protein
MYLWAIYFREFLEAVCMEKGPFRDIFGWPIRDVRKSLSSPVYFSSQRLLELGFVV